MSAMTFCTTTTGNTLLAFSGPQHQALFSVDLSNPTSFWSEGKNLVAGQSSGQKLTLHTCASEDDVRLLLQEITEGIKRHNSRKESRKAGLTIMAVGLLALSLYAGLRHHPLSQPGPVSQTTNGLVQQYRAMTGKPSLQAQSTIPKKQSISPAVLAANLKNAADRGYFSVPYSAGHARTLYVFSDPECPNCRAFEPLFKALSTHYNVIVFPVTATGGEKTVAEVSPVLCLPADKRKEAWDKLFSIDDNMLHPAAVGETHPAAAVTGEHCDIATKALAVNDVAFHAYQFPGTPWVIADDGRHVPQSAMQSPETMTTFMTRHEEK